MYMFEWELSFSLGRRVIKNEWFPHETSVVIYSFFFFNIIKASGYLWVRVAYDLRHPDSRACVAEIKRLAKASATMSGYKDGYESGIAQAISEFETLKSERLSLSDDNARLSRENENLRDMLLQLGKAR